MKLTALVDAVNSSNNSHMIEAGEFSTVIADTLITSAIINEQGDDPMIGNAPGNEGQP